MFNDIGRLELVTLVVLAVLVFGPDKLPKVIQDVTRTIRKIREFSDSAKAGHPQRTRPGVQGLRVRGPEPQDVHPQAAGQRRAGAQGDPQRLRPQEGDGRGHRRGPRPRIGVRPRPSPPSPSGPRPADRRHAQEARGAGGTSARPSTRTPPEPYRSRTPPSTPTPVAPADVASRPRSSRRLDADPSAPASRSRLLGAVWLCCRVVVRTVRERATPPEGGGPLRADENEEASGQWRRRVG